MHSEAVASMYRKCGSVQTAVYRDTLQRKLLMPGKIGNYLCPKQVSTQNSCMRATSNYILVEATREIRNQITLSTQKFEYS